jgi:hypothetical protein
MMTPMVLPVTLATAGVMGVIYQVLAARVSHGRLRYRISLGDGGNKDMQNRVRTHGNFAEYVPFLLILMGLLELAGTNPTVLAWCGGGMVVCRVMHAIGIHRKAPNPFRFVGMLGTFLLLLSGSVYALILAVG